jgi:hypothetical protein
MPIRQELPIDEVRISGKDSTKSLNFEEFATNQVFQLAASIVS